MISKVYLDWTRIKACALAGAIILSLLAPTPVMCAGADLSNAARVEMFTPQGEVKGVRQAVARFSEEIVSFGDPRLEDPFIVKCPVAGKGRWADGKNWVYDFDKDLKAGQQCMFLLKYGLKSLRGAGVTGQSAFSFNTGGPQVVSVNPRGGSEHLVEDQAFLLTLDGDVQEESAQKNVFCYIQATKEKVGVRVLRGSEEDAIIKTGSRYDGSKSADRLVVQCRRPLPNNSAVDLIWDKGVLSKSGVPSSSEQVFHYKTREPFTATFHCERDNPKAQCNPFLPMSVGFSASIPKALAAKVMIKAGKKIYRPKIETGSETVENVMVQGPFPEKTSFIVTLPPGIKDDAGRPLTNAGNFPLTVKTDPYPPLAKFSSRFGIIEKSEPVLPVTVRNIEPFLRGKVREVPGEPGLADKTKNLTSDLLTKARGLANKAGITAADGLVTKVAATIKPVEGDLQIIEWLQNVAAVGRTRSLLKGESKAKTFSMPKPLGQKAFEVIGIPFKKTGFYVVELESDLLGANYLRKKAPMYVHTSALVTNLSAHLKLGRESSLVWVTSLDKGEPVEGAKVTIRDCFGKSYWEGETDKNGIAYIDKTLPDQSKIPYMQRKWDDDAHYDHSQIEPIASMNSGLFAFVKTVDDMTFVHSSWSRGIEPYQFRLPYTSYARDDAGPFIHTVLDRMLFRAGETVHMKHLIRKPTKNGFGLENNLPSTVTIEHSGSGNKFTLPAPWDKARGVSETTWPIPKEAKLGLYRVYFEVKVGQYGRQYDAGEFRVQEFKLPLMKGAIKPLSETLVNVARAEVDLMAEYLTGGGAKGLPIKLRAQTMPKGISFDDYEKFVFSRGAVKEGIVRRDDEYMEGFEQESEDELDGMPYRPRGRSRGTTALKTSELTLGEGGMVRTALEGIPSSSVPLDLMAEMEFKDPNGKVVTISKAIPVWPAKVIVGFDADHWITFRDSLKIKAIALDLSGKPMQGVPVKVALYQKKYYSHRKRLVGGFYAYESNTEVKRTGLGCQGTTDAQGMLFCEIEKPVAGSVLIEATATDDAGNVAATNGETWVAGKQELWFDASSSDRIDLIPDKQRYEPGETAFFQVRMPMREATALVTVEREGVIDSFVTRLSGKNPVLKVPIKGSYAPNIFVSAFCVRGRTGGGKPTAFIDMAKPVFKLGIAGVSVGWQAHELKVSVASDKKTYKVRDKVLFKVRVTTATGTPLPKGSEVAFAVVDDGLLELMPNRSWDLLEQMMRKRGYSIMTSTAQMQVVGRRHYGLKAVPFGGGGGRQITRELFDTLLVWKGSLKLDEKGEAGVEVALNDSLTSFTAVAVATGGIDLFGTGRTHIQSTQDLMVLSGLSDLTREGDRFRAVFTIRNTTAKAFDTETTARITDDRGSRELPAIREILPAGEAKEIGWDVAVPIGAKAMKWEASVKDRAGKSSDSLRVTQKVVPAVATRVFQASITQVDKQAGLAVERPKDAVSDKGGVRLSFKAKLSDDVSGITRFMTDYLYTCLEQRVSKAVTLQDASLWQQIVKELPTYIDSDGLLKYFPSMDQGSDVLTSYVVAVTHEAGLEIPSNLLSTVRDGLQKYVEGRLRRESPIPRPDLTIRRLAAIEALSRLGSANPGHLQLIDVQPNLWPTSAILDWTNILNRVTGIPERERRLNEAAQVIRSRLNFQGTHMGFSTEKDDYLWWLMINGDVNAVRSCPDVPRCA